MARKEIALGIIAGDGTGTPLRVGGGKINDNFKELYSGIVEVNDNPATPSAGHILIYRHSDGRILMKNSDNQVIQVDRWKIKDNLDNVAPSLLYLKFGQHFTIQENGDNLLVTLSEAHLIHEQNTDTKLAEGTEFEISAEELWDLLVAQKDLEVSVAYVSGWIFPPVNEFVEVFPTGINEGYRVIYNDNKIYTYENNDWVLDNHTTDLSLIDKWAVFVYDSPEGYNKFYIWDNDLGEWVYAPELDLYAGRFQTIFSENGRMARPFFGEGPGSSIRLIQQSGKYAFFEDFTNIPQIEELQEPGIALIDCIVEDPDNLVYLYYRLATGEMFVQFKKNGVYSEWRRLLYYDEIEDLLNLEEELNQRIYPPLVKSSEPEVLVNNESYTYLADCTSNHVKFVLPDPSTCIGQTFKFRHIKGDSFTMTVERTVGNIVVDEVNSTLISSEGLVGFWFTLESDGTDFYLISDSGLTITNLDVII